MANTTQKTQIKSQNKPAEPSHKVRTFFSALAGTFAVWLILSSLTVVWLNRTLTDTNTFVKTVGPLVEKPAIQHLVADKVTDNVVKNAPTKDLAKELLPNAVVVKSPDIEQLKTSLRPIIENNVLKIVQSQQFDSVWQQTIQTSHASLVQQINSSNPTEISLDLSPAVNGVIAQMKTTQLSPIVKNIKIKPDTGKLNIKSDKLAAVHHYYMLLKQATIVIILLAIVMVAVCISLSVHHGKTIRRILLLTGIFALLQAAILQTPSLITITGQNAVEQDAARVIIQSLVHNLQVASLAVGIVCIGAAFGSKLYAKIKK